MVPVTKINRSHTARMGWAPHPINYILIALLCIDSPISCNICVFEVYKGHMGHANLISRRNFSVNTDRWAAAVVAIDQLPRKIASVTDTKVEKNAMSEDKINEEQRTYIDSIRNDEMLIYVYMVYI